MVFDRMIFQECYYRHITVTYQEEIKEEFENLVIMVQVGFNSVHEEMVVIRKGDVAVLKNDVTVLKDDVFTLKMKPDSLEEKVDVLDAKVSRIDMRIENQADSLYGDMHKLRDRVAVVGEKTGIAPPKSKLLSVQSGQQSTR